jgi:hypothetical protein
MTENEQGHDSELDYIAVDNPFWDCTPGAHPAWWRGEEYGAKSMIRLVNKWLDAPLKDLDKGTGYPEVQALKERIRDLRTKRES